MIVARYVEDLPVADVATAMGRTQGWVKVTASRALKKLTPPADRWSWTASLSRGAATGIAP